MTAPDAPDAPRDPYHVGPPTYKALHRVADRVEEAMRELLPHTFRELVSEGKRLVARLREQAEEEMEDQWPK